MKYQELTIGETYLYNNNKEYKVLYKHDETQSIFVLNLMSNTTSRWTQVELKNFKPKVKTLPERGLLVTKSGTLVYRTKEKMGYGFNTMGNFTEGENFSFESHPEEWREATKEDYKRFKDLVTQHLKSLGFNDEDSFISFISSWRTILNFDGGIAFNLDGITLGGNYVYYNNKWIQPISAQKKLKKEIETRIQELEQTIQQLKKDIKE